MRTREARARDLQKEREEQIRFDATLIELLQKVEYERHRFAHQKAQVEKNRMERMHAAVARSRRRLSIVLPTLPVQSEVEIIDCT